MCLLISVDVDVEDIVFHENKGWVKVVAFQCHFYGGENHQPAAGHWQTLSHNVVSSTPRLSGVWTHNISGDKHWLHMLIKKS